MAVLTNEQKQVLKSLPIQGYLDWRGIEYKQTSRRQLALVEHDSLVVNMSKNTFYWNSRQVGGDLVAFIKEYDQVDLKTAFTERLAYARYLQGENIDVNEKYQRPAAKSYDFDFSKWRLSQDQETAKAYLVDVRKLDATFVERLATAGFVQQGVSYKDKATGVRVSAPVIFPWFDSNNKVVGADIQGTEINFEKFEHRGTEKRIAGGSDEDNFGFNFKFGDGSENLYVFETPIDALSYTQQNLSTLAKENAMVLSMAGLKQHKVWATMNRMFETSNRTPSDLIIATDNDLAGYQFAKRMNAVEYENLNMIRRIPVQGKDWNEQLQAGKRGYRDMDMAASERRLATLEAYAAQNAELNEANNVDSAKPGLMETTTEAKQQANQLKKEKKATLDTRQVSTAHQGKKQRTVESRAERKAKTRKQNEAIIQDALAKVKAYKDDPAEIKKYLDFVAIGGSFSPRNSMLIYAQNNDATLVRGYKQWEKDGIQVNKGEKGIKIFGAPTQLRTIVDENGQPIYWRDATDAQKKAAEAGQLKTTSLNYYPIETVFDVKQTNATLDQLPKLLPNRPIDLATDQSVEHLENVYNALIQYAGEHDVVVYDKQTVAPLRDQISHKGQLDNNGIAKGVFVRNRDENGKQAILIRDDLPLTDKIATLAHEVGHAALHSTAEASQLSQGVKEVQAEMTSYVVLKNMGIEPGEVSERYMNSWLSHSKELNPAEAIKGSVATLEVINEKNHAFYLAHGEQGNRVNENVTLADVKVAKMPEGGPKDVADPNLIVVRQRKDNDGHLHLDYYTPRAFEQAKTEYAKKHEADADRNFEQIMGEVTRASTSVTNFLSDRLSKGELQYREQSQAQVINRTQNNNLVQDSQIKQPVQSVGRGR
ncbi:toprim domain-containing protein [Weissella confusa]|uniref:toprim domain-containing protein n=1 Tax=Weissella confusa TaxID=1583 RepID=UPI00177B4CFA|nr:toprim domain-containing protein [Weissella confusa]MBD5833936.1 hypothetical protein [Weissella confusa]